LGILNSKAQIGFETAELEERLNNSKEINKNLEVVVSELQQVTRVQEAAGKLGMILTGKVDYLSAKKSDLAKR
jgi:cell division protein FtsL